MNEIKFDLTGASKKATNKAKDFVFEADKDVIKSNLQANIAEIKAEAAKHIDTHKNKPELVASIKEQVTEKIQEAEAEANMLLAALCRKHKQTVETLESAEGAGIYVAKKIQSVKNTKLFRFGRGFVNGIKEGWNK